MKNTYFSTVFLLTFMFISCQKEQPETGKETGSLRIDIGLSISVYEVNSALKSAQQTEDFKVAIYRADGTEEMAFDRASDMPAVIELETGDYYVEAHSDNDLPAAFENPYYFGSSGVFTIMSNMQHTVQVTCQLANTMVSVHYSDNITGSFFDYSTTVSSDLGSLVFNSGESRVGYFRPLPLDILVELTYQKPDGSFVNKTLSGSIPEPQANRHYEINVDASIDEGMATFQILLDSAEVLVEVINITDSSVIPPVGPVGYGDLLITEIMYDPAALSDTEGEWIEIFNSSDQTINLQNLILGRNDVNRHTITESIELQPGEYCVLSRTPQATDAALSYVYGTAITLPNTGAHLYIFNEGTESEPGSLIFSIDYGEADFPEGSGASICLNPELLNVSDAVHGTSWCVSTSVFGTGDSGTPGAANDICQ